MSQMNVQTVAWSEPTPIAQLGPSARLIRGAMVEILRAQWSSNSNIEDPSLHGRLWDEDDSKSNMLVESVSRYTPKLIGMRPAVLVGGTGERIANVTIGQGLTQSLLNEDGSDIYEATMSGGLIVSCIARSGAETEAIADEVTRYCMEFAPVIREQLCLLRFAYVETGRISILAEAREHFVAPVTFFCAWQRAWRLRKEALPLMKLSLKTVVE